MTNPFVATSRSPKPLEAFMTPIDLAFSVCASPGLDTWSVVSQHIPDRIHATSFRVIVPDHEVDLFRDHTNPRIQVVPESRYVGDFPDELRKRLPGSNRHRLGWYLQQMIKLTVLAELSANQTALIWDADTLPIHNLTFLAPTGQLRYFASRENHAPYFAAIDRLLGLNKIVPFSFIAQCFPIHGLWMQEFIRAIEEKHQQPWQRAILNAIDFNQASGFSEYETLGTFFSHRHPQQIDFAHARWLRRGNSRLGGICRIESPLLRPLVARYRFVAFERWDPINRKPPWRILLGWPFKVLVDKAYHSSRSLTQVSGSSGSSASSDVAFRSG